MPSREELTEKIDKEFLHRSGVARTKHGHEIAYAVGDEIFAFLSDDGIVLKLDKAGRGALLRSPNARPYEQGTPREQDELVELAMVSLMDMMTGMEWVRRAYAEAVGRAAAHKARRPRPFSR